MLPELESIHPSLLAKCVDRADIGAHAAAIRASGKRIVTLNGSFDLLHAGHLALIGEAADQGDHLIVALNTDASIKAYKSPSRPIVPLHYRMAMMAALLFVDSVTSFDELDPIALIREIRPDVHCNGSEYGYESIEADAVREVGGRLHIVQLVPGLSTSRLIKRIREGENG